MSYRSGHFTAFVLLMILGLFSFTGEKIKKEKSAVERYGYKGPVKLVVEWRFGAKGTKENPIRGSLATTCVLSFDSAGHLLQKAEYNGAGVSIEVTSVSSGGPIKKGTYDGKGLDNLDICKYDKSGNIIENLSYSRDYSVKSDSIKFIKTIYKYDDQNRITEYYYYNKDGKFIEKKNYTYEPGITKVNFYNAVGNVKYESVIRYDARGNETGHKTESTDKIYAGARSYQYDAHDNIIEDKLYYDGGYLSSVTTYKYDSNNNMLEEKLVGHGGTLLYYIMRYKYDSLNNKVESSRYEKEDVLKSRSNYSYDYKRVDKEGNWLKQVSFNDTVPSIITERRIEYYNYY